MPIDVLCAELERLFDLDELKGLSRDLLGVDPQAIGGTAALASFARALTQHCLASDSLEALCETLVTTRPNVDPAIAQLRITGAAEAELPLGSVIGPVTLTRKLGEGPSGVCYAANYEGVDYRVKVLKSATRRDRAGLNRYLTLTRLSNRARSASLPQGIVVGRDGQRSYTAHRLEQGETLAELVRREGPQHIEQVRPILTSLLEALGELHRCNMAHGNLKLENALSLSQPSSASAAVLLDGFSDRLTHAKLTNGQAVLGALGAPRLLAPEQLRQGRSPDARSDLYAFGLLMFEVLTGRSPFERSTALETAIARLTQPIPLPSSLAPRGWVSRELDDLLSRLLEDNPEARPAQAREVIEALATLSRPSMAPALSAAQLQQSMDYLLHDPMNEAVALALDAAANDGADPAMIAATFVNAANQLHAAADDSALEAQLGLLHRAARLYKAMGELGAAENSYQRILELRPSEKTAQAGLQAVLRKLGKFNELIESFLAEAESGTSPAARAQAWARIGKVYQTELHDREQALLAYTQAFCEDPADPARSATVEQLVGNGPWEEVLAACSQTLQQRASHETSLPLLLQLGQWYTSKYPRLDLALNCYQSVLASEPSNDKALDGVSQVYRRNQAWADLGRTLLQRAQTAPTPAKARDYRAEAADLLQSQLKDPAGAAELLRAILAEDPDHEAAARALQRLYESSGEYDKLVNLLEDRLRRAAPEAALALECNIAAVYEQRLGDVAQALRHYEHVLQAAPAQLEALEGLGRVYAAAGRWRDLLGNLRLQADAASSPRQQISLLERVAELHERELLQQQEAAAVYQQILQLDPQHERALTELARLYRGLERWQDLADLCERHAHATGDPARKIRLLLAHAGLSQDQLGAPLRASQSYEQVLLIDPSHELALRALARLKESSGDADEALSAVEALVKRTQDPGERAGHYLHAARLLQARGDLQGAVERLHLALDCDPSNQQARTALRAVLIERGEVNAAAELIERELEQTEGDAAKAKLWGELARIALGPLDDPERAERAARAALDVDPTSAPALAVMGDLALHAGRPVESAAHYERLVRRLDALGPEQGREALTRYLEALLAAEALDTAADVAVQLLQLAPGDLASLKRAAEVSFMANALERTQALCEQLFAQHAQALNHKETALFSFRLGDTRRRLGDHDRALELLRRAVELDPSNAGALESLDETLSALGDVEGSLQIKAQRLTQLDDPERRVDLLLQMAQVNADKRGDHARAHALLEQALSEQPHNRRVLLQLMKAYSETKNWARLVQIVASLGELATDSGQQTKYFMTSAMLSERELKDVDAALEYYRRVIELDPASGNGVDESLTLLEQRQAFPQMIELLVHKLDQARAADDQLKMIQSLDAMTRVYKDQLQDVPSAISACEAAVSLDPENADRAQQLAALYATDLSAYLPQAVETQMTLLRKAPGNTATYRQLRKWYTEVRRADPAWCLCQALSVLKLADADEDRFFARMKSEDPAYAQAYFSENDWQDCIFHEDLDGLLTGIFAVIEPALIVSRGQTYESLGYHAGMRVDLSRRPDVLGQTLNYAALVMSLPPPPAFENAQDAEALGFLHANPPSLKLGAPSPQFENDPQAMAFLGAQHLTYLKPGFYARQLVGSGTGLKAWLFAAIRLISPSFPASPDLETPITEGCKVLDAQLSPQAKDTLAAYVSKLVKRPGGIDLKGWIRAVDLTADRAGLILAHSLPNAIRALRATPGPSSLDAQQRIKELVLYSVGEKYFEIRKRLGIAIA